MGFDQSCLSEAVESKLVKLETNCSAILPLTLSVLWSYLSDCHWVAKNGALTWVINWRDFSLRPLVFCLCEADKQETLLKYFRHFKLEASKRVSIHFLSAKGRQAKGQKRSSPYLCVWNGILSGVMLCKYRVVDSSMSVWPDLAKFRHLGKIKKVIGIFSGFISYLAELKNLVLPNKLNIRQICCRRPNIDKSILAIWSHWSPLKKFHF